MWVCGLIANWKPGKQETAVDEDNDDRAPLLFIAGGADHIMPHWTCAESGWEQIADYALSWAVKHATGATVGTPT